jgi:uncharacterized protein with GYD domain
MPRYILLDKFTDQGAKGIRDSPTRIRAAEKEAEKLGCKVTFYLTFGEYDTIGMLEAPNDEAVLSFASYLAGLGNIKTMTLKAFTVDEVEKILSRK